MKLRFHFVLYPSFKAHFGYRFPWAPTTCPLETPLETPLEGEAVVKEGVKKVHERPNGKKDTS